MTPIDPTTNGGAQTGTSWDDSEEQKEAEEKLAFAERVKAASEKEAARALKTLEYEKRMSSSYPESRWDDPFHLVSCDGISLKHVLENSRFLRHLIFRRGIKSYS